MSCRQKIRTRKPIPLSRIEGEGYIQDKIDQAKRKASQVADKTKTFAKATWKDLKEDESLRDLTSWTGSRKNSVAASGLEDNTEFDGGAYVMKPKTERLLPGAAGRRRSGGDYEWEAADFDGGAYIMKPKTERLLPGAAGRRRSGGDYDVEGGSDRESMSDDGDWEGAGFVDDVKHLGSKAYEKSKQVANKTYDVTKRGVVATKRKITGSGVLYDQPCDDGDEIDKRTSMCRPSNHKTKSRMEPADFRSGGSRSTKKPKSFDLWEKLDNVSDIVGSQLSDSEWKEWTKVGNYIISEYKKSNDPYVFYDTVDEFLYLHGIDYENI
jgi:hypothetical protein